MSRKTAGKAKTVRRAKAVRKTRKGLPPIDAERLLGLIASMQQLIHDFPGLPVRQEAPPLPEEPLEPGWSFLPANEESIRLFEWTAVADALLSLAWEMIEIDKNVMTEAYYGYYWAEERIACQDETLSDEELAKLVSYMEDVRAAWRQKYGTDIPPKK